MQKKNESPITAETSTADNMLTRVAPGKSDPVLFGYNELAEGGEDDERVAGQTLKAATTGHALRGRGVV